MENRHFIVASSNKNIINRQLEKLSKRAMRLGLPEIVWNFDKPFVNTNGKLMIPIDISGPLTVNYANWEFVATLQHLPTGENIIRSILDNAEIPNQYRSNGSICEHCKVNRYRKDTYLVRHAINGSFVQVGSSCIKDFLGGNSPDNILQRANLAAEIVSFINGNEFGEPSSEPTYFINNFLEQTSACISIYGWLSKSKAYDSGGVATVSRVQDSLLGNSSKIEISDFDIKKAESAIDWVESLSDQEVENSDYLYNIRAIVRSGLVEWRTMGFAASIISAFDRAQTSNKIRIISNHVGTVKTREVFTLRSNNKFEYVGSYGVTYKYIFNDEFGNVIIWNASKPQDFIAGHKYLVRGTIKAHSEFKGVKQTEINRCEILCEVGD